MTKNEDPRSDAQPIMRPLWHREPCWECGAVGLATRTRATPVTKPYHCEGCEMMLRFEADTASEDARIDAMGEEQLAADYPDALDASARAVAEASS